MEQCSNCASSEMHDFSLLEDKLNVKFKNKDLLEQAFVHRSYLNENPNFHLHHNERLEFLGDAVLELVVTEHLYNEHPDKPEGEMTSWRAALVNAKMLSAIAKELDLNAFLLLSKGETKETGKARDYILANTMEAFIGALYLDQGLKNTEKFTVLKEWGPDHAKNFQIGVYLDKELVAEGEGSSKQEAEQDAAHNALEKKRWK